MCFVSGRNDTYHSAATVPGGHSGQQSRTSLQSFWSSWAQLPVVQRQWRGQCDLSTILVMFSTFYVNNTYTFIVSMIPFIDPGWGRKHTTAGSLSSVLVPQGPLYLQGQPWCQMHLFPVGPHWCHSLWRYSYLSCPPFYYLFFDAM